MKKSDLKKVHKIISGSNDIAIAGHINPDGDCIGSLLALGIGLESIGKRVHLLLQDPVPRKYKDLPYADKIKTGVRKAPDLAITVDCNAEDMVGKPFDMMRKARCVVAIDHHEYRKPFGDLSIVDTKAASVGEMVFDLLKYLKISITRDIARNILTSIIVETNSFRLPVVRPVTFSVCAEMLKTGVDYHDISELVYWSRTRQEALLSAICMDRMVFLKKGRIAWSEILRKDFAGIKGKDEDVDAVADDMRMIDTVKIAILFREKSAKLLRVSLRSKDGINVASLARKYGGGGHFDCAGCHIPNDGKTKHDMLRAAAKLLKK